MTTVFGVTELMGRWRLRLQAGISKFVTAGLTLLSRGGGKGAGSSKEVREGENKGPGVLDLDCEDWRPRVLEQEVVTQPPGPGLRRVKTGVTFLH